MKLDSPQQTSVLSSFTSKKHLYTDYLPCKEVGMRLQLTQNDEYYTTRSVWESIAIYLPKDKVIWECFYSPKSKSADHLRDLGFNVIYDDLDFFIQQPPEYDLLVSNLPFSLKKEVFIRLKQIDKPFCMIIPTLCLQTQYFKKIFKEDSIQLILPSRKTNFEGENLHPRGASFYICFLCYKMNLPQDIILL